MGTPKLPTPAVAPPPPTPAMLAPPKKGTQPTLGNTYLTAGAIGTPNTKNRKTLLG
jgi:hypothetical protein